MMHKEYLWIANKDKRNPFGQSSGCLALTFFIPGGLAPIFSCSTPYFSPGSRPLEAVVIRLATPALTGGT